jgi:hypothetical protein
MKYSTIEQAAIEASVGVKEVDAEIQRLKAKRDLLATIAQQLSAVLPAIAEAFPGDGNNQTEPARDTPPAERPSFMESDASASYAGAAPYATGTVAEQEAPAAPRSFAELFAQSKTFSLRNEGWPASAGMDQQGLRQLL